MLPQSVGNASGFIVRLDPTSQVELIAACSAVHSFKWRVVHAWAASVLDCRGLERDEEESGRQERASLRMVGLAVEEEVVSLQRAGRA